MNELLSEIRELLYREALCLDERRWDEWLSLYCEEIRFWVPAWKSEDEPTGDPETEISLIYLTSRERLAERISRIRSGKSAASLVLPRTAHAISNVTAQTSKGSAPILVRSVCVTHLYDPARRIPASAAARYEHLLVRDGDGLRIKGKKIVLLNDDLSAKLDFYMI